ncbi:hypothetical protein BDD43_0089 [Mucilaginibacter gracilis]|uniref:Uncharacterized protein n=1 Tax=Mucilaginibacter gracilis TaxID=423350 RepID=A0A495ITV0_9SPHI|nr:hypothetical protein [Mucilaginibacter gracilis]RKR80002.1 hypothetical protein BDD43_0089 [Mucilaginibacter gracilis]
MNTTKLHHVKSFNTAIADGHEPRLYSYHKEDVPTGEYHVSLDFMIWAKNIAGVDLFCTVTQTGQAIRLTVFRDRDEDYKLHNVYVPLIPPGSTLSIQVELNGREKPVLHKITIIEEPERT